MSRRTRRTFLVVAAVLLLLAVAIFLRSKAPPEAARLLPESDGIIYVNLRPVRTFFRVKLKPPQRVPEYEEFVEATGIDWERDLDEAAIALHRMPDPNGPNGPVAYSMVLVGKLTGARLNHWFDTHATSREIYAGHTIYNVPSEGRTVRVAQIGYDMVAVSNTPTPEQIHSMLDRHRTAALPFAGSTLLSQHFHDVPLLSLAWGVGQIGLPFSESGAIQVLGFRLPLQADSTIVASLTPELTRAGSLRLRVEEFAPTDEAAEGQASALSTLVSLARGFTLPLSDNAANRGLKEVLKTAVVSQKRNRVVMTATLPGSLFAGLVSGASASTAAAPGPVPQASK
ncbi:MAG TPA: hypothetical protein VHX39_19550 [Acetobacteraceae bacterium]|jgi:hypothetical protein|nr:hypothetical protein [Acetobacteraceae bacterium]